MLQEVIRRNKGGPTRPGQVRRPAARPHREGTVKDGCLIQRRIRYDPGRDVAGVYRPYPVAAVRGLAFPRQSGGRWTIWPQLVLRAKAWDRLPAPMAYVKRGRPFPKADEYSVITDWAGGGPVRHPDPPGGDHPWGRYPASTLP